MNRSLYTAMSYFLVPFRIITSRWKSRAAQGGQKRIRAHFGFVQENVPSSVIWLHVANAREAQNVQPVFRRWLNKHPEEKLLITCTQMQDGKSVAKLFGKGNYYCTLPFDLPGATKRFLLATRPRLFLVVGTTLRPNLYRAIHTLGIPLVMLNAALPIRLARNYGLISNFVRQILAHVNPIGVQSKADAARFIALGAKQERIRITGRLDNDVELPDSWLKRAQELQKTWGADRVVWLAANTHIGEEGPVLDSLRKLSHRISGLLLVLVPNKVERLGQVAVMCRQRGFSVTRSDRNEMIKPSTQVLLMPPREALPAMYGAASVTFVGGTLIPNGNNNLLEPAAAGVPMVTGPVITKNTDIFKLLETAHSVALAKDTAQISAQIQALIQDRPRAEEMAQAAQRVIDNNRGAQNRVLAILEEQLQVV